MKYIKDITKQRISVAVLAALMLGGCKKEQMTPTSDSYPIVLAPTVGQQTEQKTKYSGGADFDVNDAISVYSVAWNSETAPTLSVDPSGNNFHNAKFIRDALYFNFSPTDAVTSVGFPPNGGNIDIYAFSPFDATAIAKVEEYNFKAPIDQSSKAKMISGDFLVAKKDKVAPQLQPINLVFKHMMAKLVVDVTVADDYKAKTVDVSSIKLILVPDGKINIATQAAILDIKDSLLAVDITPFVTDKTDKADGCVAEAIVAPQIIPKNRVFLEVMMSNAKSYRVDFDANYSLLGNTITQLSLKVSFGSANVLSVSGVKITDWTTGDALTPSNPAWQVSDNKFTVTATGDVEKAANVKYAAVMVQVAGETRTYELPVIYDAESKNLSFEFRGVGNRPNTYPFTVKRVDYYNAAWGLVVSSGVLTSSVSNADENIVLTQSF